MKVSPHLPGQRRRLGAHLAILLGSLGFLCLVSVGCGPLQKIEPEAWVKSTYDRILPPVPSLVPLATFTATPAPAPTPVPGPTVASVRVKSAPANLRAGPARGTPSSARPGPARPCRSSPGMRRARGSSSGTGAGSPAPCSRAFPASRSRDLRRRLLRHQPRHPGDRPAPTPPGHRRPPPRGR